MADPPPPKPRLKLVLKNQTDWEAMQRDTEQKKKTKKKIEKKEEKIEKKRSTLTRAQEQRVDELLKQMEQKCRGKKSMNGKDQDDSTEEEEEEEEEEERKKKKHEEETDSEERKKKDPGTKTWWTQSQFRPGVGQWTAAPTASSEQRPLALLRLPLRVELCGAPSRHRGIVLRMDPGATKAVKEQEELAKQKTKNKNKKNKNTKKTTETTVEECTTVLIQVDLTQRELRLVRMWRQLQLALQLEREHRRNDDQDTETLVSFVRSQCHSRRWRVRRGSHWYEPATMASMQWLAQTVHYYVARYLDNRQRHAVACHLRAGTFGQHEQYSKPTTFRALLAHATLTSRDRRVIYVWRRYPDADRDTTEHGCPVYVGKTDQERHNRDADHRYGKSTFDLILDNDLRDRTAHWEVVSVCQYPESGNAVDVTMLEILWVLLFDSAARRPPPVVMRGLNTEIGGSWGAEQLFREIRDAL